MNQNSQVMIGVLQVDLPPWDAIFKFGQIETWMNNPDPLVEIVNLYGRKPSKTVDRMDKLHEKLRLNPLGNGITNKLDLLATLYWNKSQIPPWNEQNFGNYKRLDVDIPSTYLTQVIREFSLFNYFLKQSDAEYLYMTNTSSYLNVNLLLELISELPNQNLYGGTKVEFDGFSFYSGANRIFSRDVIEFLVSNYHNLDFRLLNDVAIGKLMSKINYTSFEISSMIFSNKVEIESTELSSLKKNIHFRLKSGTIDNRSDIDLMKLLHSILVSN